MWQADKRLGLNKLLSRESSYRVEVQQSDSPGWANRIGGSILKFTFDYQSLSVIFQI